MKRLRKIAISTVSVFTLLMAMSMVALAAGDVPEVTFNANTEEFTYKNTDTYVADDGTEFPNLFTDEDFAYAIPGDSLTQEIEVKATNISGATVKIYLHSENETQDYDEIMESAILTVYYEGVEISSGTLAEGILLGTFTSDGTVNLTVEFSIPLEVGNEIANLYGTIDWVFVAELIEDEPEILPEDEPEEEPEVEPEEEPEVEPEEEPEVEPEEESEVEPEEEPEVEPQTGDNSNILLWGMLLVISVIGGFFVVRNRIKE